jgi:hypothetical protein
VHGQAKTTVIFHRFDRRQSEGWPGPESLFQLQSVNTLHE